MADVHKPYRVLERGDIFFFYRPKVNREEAHSVDEVQRFYMLLRPLDSGERADGGGKAEEAEEEEGRVKKEGGKEDGGGTADREVAGERGVRAANRVRGRGDGDAESVKREEGEDGDGRKRGRGDGEGGEKGEAEGEGLRRKQVKQEPADEAAVEKLEEKGEGGRGKQNTQEDEEKKEQQQAEEEEEKGVAKGAEGSGEADEEGKADERPPLRLLVVGRKLLPTPSHRSRPHRGYVDAVSPHVAEIRAALEGDTYETKTRGTQHVAAARAAAAGRYLIVSHVPGARVSHVPGARVSRGAARSSSRKSHTHLVYSLRWPEAAGAEEKAGGQQGPEGGEGEQASGKEKVGEGKSAEQAGEKVGEGKSAEQAGEKVGEGKSAEQAGEKVGEGKSAEQAGEKVGEGKSAEQAGEKKREEEREQEIPQEAFNIEREASYVLQQRLDGLRFAPADPPGFLDHPGCELLLIGASDDLQREFGGEVRRDLAVGEGEGGGGGVRGAGEGELGGGEESGYGSGCEGDEWMGFVREGLGWRSEELGKPVEAGEWA
ncbi:unnamed protein product [Closterium sp. Naga37s-1]|nr:unnamed protein product [Closterium sp. Naga37s-1]